MANGLVIAIEFVVAAFVARVTARGADSELIAFAFQRFGCAHRFQIVAFEAHRFH